MPEVSVIICTHNPREDYLRRVLDALKAQTLPKDRWELLLVDNASTPPLAGRWDLAWHPQARQLREEHLGLTHARLCGIAAAQAELLVFVDDDNVLRADYLQAALKISAEHPLLGAWGGTCLGEFEIEPPAELGTWICGLVLEKVTAPVWAKLRIGSAAAPPGAGLVVRQKLARHYRELVRHEPLRLSLDRAGTKLGSGGDTDMALSGFDLGLGTGKFPELELTHLIPAQRLTLEYLEGLYEGFGFSGAILHALHSPELVSRPRPLDAWENFARWLGLQVFIRNRADRRLRWARRRGGWLAAQELLKIGYFDAPGRKNQ
jgi:hypothetical protein